MFWYLHPLSWLHKKSNGRWNRGSGDEVAGLVRSSLWVVAPLAVWCCSRLVMLGTSACPRWLEISSGIRPPLFRVKFVIWSCVYNLLGPAVIRLHAVFLYVNELYILKRS
jgi:hypothetical protein